MSNKRRAILTLGILSSLTLVTAGVNAIETDVTTVVEQQDENEKLDSNLFTQAEDKRDFEHPNPSLRGFDLIAENEQLALYVEETTLAIKIKNKQTNYLWSSTLDNMADHQLNESWQNYVKSAITVDYLNQQGNEQTMNLLTPNTDISVERETDGFKAKITFEPGLSFRLEVALEADKVTVRIPEESMVETENARFVALTTYPFLGAAKGTEIPGYIFVPDGSGGLLRYQDEHLRMNFPYSAQVYGTDIGIEDEHVEPTSNPVNRASIPVFGVAHGADQDAFVAVINEGSEYANLEAYKAGLSTEFHWVHSEFVFRKPYRQTTNRQGTNALNLYQEDANKMTIETAYHFLSDENANYVGMAKAYQAHLVQTGTLRKNTEVGPLMRLEFLGGERKPGLFWDTTVSMTTLDDIVTYGETFSKDDMANLLMVYKGWGDGGLTGSFPNKFPIETYGSSKTAKQVTEELNEMGIPFYFHTDYTEAYERPRGLGAPALLEQINANDFTINRAEQEIHYLIPKASHEIFASDVEKFNSEGVNRLAIENTAEWLFSVYNKDKQQSRTESKDTIKALLEQAHVVSNEQLALYEPNQYAWEYTDRYFDIPMGSSNFIFMSDTVPFLQIALKGYVDYYAPFSNFSSNKQDDLLRQIDYGAFPSFFLTTNDPYELEDTPSQNVFNSQISSWTEEMQTQYKVMEKYADATKDAAITSREVLESGVVKVTYDNESIIFVNYTNDSQEADGQTIEAKAYLIQKGGE